MRFQSRRIADLVQSDIRAMTQECKEQGGINLGQGICDTPPPSVLLDNLIPAVNNGYNSYTRFDGIQPLRESLAAKVKRDSGLVLDPETNFVVTSGTTGAFTCIINALSDPGDRILMFEPYYGYHMNAAVLAGLEPVFVPTRGEDFSLDVDSLEKLAKGARAIVVNTPSNPSGHVFSRQELETIAEICQRYDLLCITDEIYEYFLFDGYRHISMATIPGMWERTVTLAGFSKTFSITGWRIGYATGPDHLMLPIGIANDLYYACAPAPLQYAVARALDSLGPDFYSRLAEEHQQKRDLFCSTLARVGLTPHIPQGAYYVLADVSKLGCRSSKEAAMYILDKASIACVPGSAFFEEGRGEHLVRFCFGKDDSTLERACELLEQLK
ncbi:aminotransferase [Hahella sp. CCB-MM4]|uniref:pyridoxal phosphate-dependent aminotransferase n=1 Tax=Hahella sp. (strain CCB-MM4) TaxID=1926491 RepID=UPI000B9BEF8D|nr:pyridoxal phosphate-dependent aminotransferase [Hahella sp. CCB-MM4]OZG72837.1 aminotransferase [Hahella sp. CCB-MM4]